MIRRSTHSRLPAATGSTQTTRRTLASVAWLAAGTALALAAGCAHLPQPEGPPGPGLRFPRLLDSDHDKLLIELDQVEGTAPRPRALRTFLQRIDLYLDKPGGIELVYDDRIPAAEYSESSTSVRRMARRHRSQRRHPRGRWAYLHLIYAPRYKGYRGFAWNHRLMADSAGTYNAALVLILQEELKPILWVTGAKQEASVLVHELGHTLGLSTNPGHSFQDHCTNAECLMYDGIDARTFWLYLFPTLLTGYLPLDYCRDCLDDLYPEHGGVPPGRR